MRIELSAKYAFRVNGLKAYEVDSDVHKVLATILHPGLSLKHLISGDFSNRELYAIVGANQTILHLYLSTKPGVIEHMRGVANMQSQAMEE